MILHIEETSCFVISFDLLDEKIALVLDVTNVMAKVEIEHDEVLHPVAIS